MKSSAVMELPKNYKSVRDWHLPLLGGVVVLSVIDVIFMRAFDFGEIYTITSAILGILFLAEIILRVVRKQTLIGYRFALYLAIFYILTDILIYTFPA